MNNTPELNLMLLCSKNHASLRCNDRLNNIFNKPLIYDLFISLLAHHRLYGPAYRTLSYLELDSIPYDVQNHIRMLYHRNIEKGLNVIDEMKNVSMALIKEDIPHIFLKGVCLSQLLYEDPFFRHVGDIDLLVSEELFDDTWIALENNGYRQKVFKGECGTKQINKLKKNEIHLSFISPQKKIPIEVHWRLNTVDKTFPVSFSDMYAQHRNVRIDGFNFPFLGNHHLLLHLLSHGAHHAWERLFWLKDIYDLVGMNGQVLLDVLEQDPEHKMHRMAGECLYLFKRFYGLDIPKHVKDRINKDVLIKLGVIMIYCCQRLVPNYLKKIPRNIHWILSQDSAGLFMECVSSIFHAKLIAKTFNPDHKSDLMTALRKRWL